MIFKGLSGKEVVIGVLTAPIWLPMMLIMDLTRLMEWLAAKITGGDA